MDEIAVFTELIGCINRLYVWRYSSNLTLEDTTCPDASYWDNIFQIASSNTGLYEYCQSNHFPVLISNHMEILWIAAPQHDCEINSLKNIYVLGPLFLSTLTESQMKRAIEQKEMSLPLKRDLMARLKQLPIVPHSTFMLLGIMLHFCLTGERISISDIQVLKSSEKLSPSLPSEDTSPEDIHGGATYEELMLKLIEEGNLDYKNILSSATSGYGRVGTLAPGSPVRQFKNEIIVAITLCSRAAIRGGLSRELALTLSDYYIQAVEAASNIPEISVIKQTMHEDYTKRVYQHKIVNQYSSIVRTCIDVINQHIQEKLTVTEIARLTGYSGYYISSVFKKETGIRIGDYVKQQKVNLAKILLANSQESINDIAIHLNFSTSSHFISIFHQFEGCTPKEYREQIKYQIP